jgi:hypothetical protein
VAGFDNRLIESQLLGRRSGIIVADVPAESRVHHDLVRAARTQIRKPNASSRSEVVMMWLSAVI